MLFAYFMSFAYNALSLIVTIEYTFDIRICIIYLLLIGSVRSPQTALCVHNSHMLGGQKLDNQFHITTQHSPHSISHC